MLFKYFVIYYVIMFIVFSFEVYVNSVSGTTIVHANKVKQCTDPGLFRCSEEPLECIDPTLKCNGVSECSNGADENVLSCGELNLRIFFSKLFKNRVEFGNKRIWR